MLLRTPSSQEGIRGFFPSTFDPNLHKNSESNPAGHIHPQNPFFNKRETAVMANKIIRPDG